MTTTKAPTPSPVYRTLYFQVVIAMVIGVMLGFFYPSAGERMKPLGDGFINLIRMMIAPIIFFTVAVGIGNVGDMRKVGRVGLKALLYFEVVTTFALLMGLLVVTIFEPGAGIKLIGVDRFMSQMRSLTNLIGNGVATIVVAKWEQEFDRTQAIRVLNGEADVEQEEPVLSKM